MDRDPIPSPDTLPAAEAHVWRTAFVVACFMDHNDRSENGTTEAFAQRAADRVLGLYRDVCEKRAKL